MPPKTQGIPIPKGRGKSAKEWLEAYGFMPRTPAIRSSDYEMCLHCPFQYYLSRRLGLVPCLRWSSALSRGSWFHSRAELMDETPEVALQQMGSLLKERNEELLEICNNRGIVGEERSSIIQREERDMLTATSWFEAASTFKIPGKDKTFIEYLNANHFRILDHEVLAKYEHPDFGTLIAQYDLLLYHEKQDKVFIVDFKTCSESPILRLSTCPIEFQTQHYLQIAKYLLDSQVMNKKYDLLDTTGVGGMLHIAVKKPTISFGQRDRDFEVTEHTLTRGPRKGQTEIRRKYLGEPRFENYLRRVKSWYHATDEYEDEAPLRVSDPPVNISTTYGSITKDQSWVHEYHSRLNLIRHYCSVFPAPGNFPSSAGYIRSFSKLSPFAPFYLTPVTEWPSVLQREGFIFEDRDEVARSLEENEITTIN